MNKEQFDKLEAQLYERGYKKYVQHWWHEDYAISKGFHKADNIWDDDRSGYQIHISVYDYSTKDWERLDAHMRNYVGLEIRVLVSRIIDERYDFVFTWHDDTTIEEVEDAAEKFYQFVCDVWKEPKKY